MIIRFLADGGFWESLNLEVKFWGDQARDRTPPCGILIRAIIWSADGLSECLGIPIKSTTTGGLPDFFESFELIEDPRNGGITLENQCHWVLDTVFRGDLNQTHAAKAAKNLGTMRRIVLNILKDDPGTIKTLPKKRFEALMNIAYRERLLSLA